MSAVQTVDVRGNRLRGLADWLDSPELCQELMEADGSSQMATMCWGAAFSCRICQVRCPLVCDAQPPNACGTRASACMQRVRAARACSACVQHVSCPRARACSAHNEAFGGASTGERAGEQPGPRAAGGPRLACSQAYQRPWGARAVGVLQVVFGSRHALGAIISRHTDLRRLAPCLASTAVRVTVCTHGCGGTQEEAMSTGIRGSPPSAVEYVVEHVLEQKHCSGLWSML